MAEEELNGHNPDMDMPEIEVGESSAPGSNIPGLKNIFVQPNVGGGMWNPIERAMRGTTKPEEYLALTNVTEDMIHNHMRVQFYQNIANYGDGLIEDIIWSEYQLRRALNGEFMSQVVDMVIGERQNRKNLMRDAANSVFNRARGHDSPTFQPGKLTNGSS